MAAGLAGRMVQINLRPTQTTGTGPRRQPRDRGRHAPAAGGPLEPVGPVPPPHRTPPNHHLPGLRQHRVPSVPMPGVRRGGGHPTACHAAMPVPRWSSPPRAGLHIRSAIRPTTRRRGGGLGRRLPLVLTRAVWLRPGVSRSRGDNNNNNNNSQDEPSRTPHKAMPSRAEPNIRTDDSSFGTLIYPARS